MNPEGSNGNVAPVRARRNTAARRAPDILPAMANAGESGWERLLPGLAVLRHYDRAWLRPDVMAGLTVTAYLVPQVMAYAQIAGLPPVVGLWGMIAPLAVYALVGSSRQLSVGPESTTALMTAAALGVITASVGPERWADAAAALAIAVGLVALLGWVARLAFLATLLSKPVLQGYLIGIAVLMISSQLGRVSRLEVDGDGPIEQVGSLVAQAGSVHLPSLAMAAATLAAVFAFQAWRPRWPGPLLVMLAAGGVAALPAASGWGLKTIGDVPLGLPLPRLPDLAGIDLLAVLPWAVGIALVGYSDNVLTGRAFAARRHEDIDAGQELFALGAINVAAGLTQGFPVSSSGSRAVLGDAMGSRTQAYSLVALAGVVLVLLVAGPVLSTFPSAAMGAIIIYAATRLVDTQALARIARFRRSEVVLTAITAVGVVVLGVLMGIGVAVALSILDVIRRIAQPHDGVLGFVPDVAGMHDIDDHPVATQVEGLVVFRYDAPLFFANAANFVARARLAVDEAREPVRCFLLNAEANVDPDLTAVDALEELRSDFSSRGIVFALARVKAEVKDLFDKAGLTAAVGEENIHATLPTAVAAYAAAFEAEVGRPPAGLPRNRPRWPAEAPCGTGPTARRRRRPGR